MTRQETIHALTRLRGLMPALNAEQGELLGSEFQRYPAEVVDRAINDHAKRFQYPQIPALLAAIHTMTPPADRPAAGASWSEKQYQAHRQDHLRAEAYWREVTAKFESIAHGLSDEAMTRLQADAVARLQEELRPLYARRDIRSSRVLQAIAVQMFDTP